MLTACLQPSRGDVSCLAREKTIFCGISEVGFRVNSTGGVFRLSVSGEVRFLPAVQTICRFQKFIKPN